MPFYYDPEDRQTQIDKAVYKAGLRPKVSAAEACSAAKDIEKEPDLELDPGDRNSAFRND